jgi:DNA-binding Lrp family transcriptional regulator
MVLTDLDCRIMAAIQGGLPLTRRPYLDIATRLGIGESELIERIELLDTRGIIKRFGIVIRHHELGYRANAMVVWDIPDNEVDEVGQKLGQFDCITLCYRRPRRLPMWRYNLFTMIHGMNRETVLESLDRIREKAELQHIHYEVLFSKRQFKQRGAHYLKTAQPGKALQQANG